MIISVEFNQDALQRIQGLAAFQSILAPHLILAHEESLNDLQTGALDWMHANFQESTGQLEGAFVQQVSGPDLSELSNPEDYAWRREKGFSGMTDSLGRFYPHDPGIAYMENAIVLERDQVETNFREQVLYAFAELGVI